MHVYVCLVDVTLDRKIWLRDSTNIYKCAFRDRDISSMRPARFTQILSKLREHRNVTIVTRTQFITILFKELLTLRTTEKFIKMKYP